jgi:hypothetical protein
MEAELLPNWKGICSGVSVTTLVLSLAFTFIFTWEGIPIGSTEFVVQFMSVMVSTCGGLAIGITISMNGGLMVSLPTPPQAAEASEEEHELLA